MAERVGLRKASPFNDIDFLTRQNCTIEPKGQFPGLSNRIEQPDPESETAAPVGAGNGGMSGKLTSNSEDKSYSTESLAARFPVIARHFGFEVAA